MKTFLITEAQVKMLSEVIGEAVFPNINIKTVNMVQNTLKELPEYVEVEKA